MENAEINANVLSLIQVVTDQNKKEEEFKLDMITRISAMEEATGQNTKKIQWMVGGLISGLFAIIAFLLNHMMKS